MKLTDFESMSIDELWALHLEMDVVLTRRISAEKNQLDQRLRQAHLEQKLGENGVPIRESSLSTNRRRLGRAVVSSRGG